MIFISPFSVIPLLIGVLAAQPPLIERVVTRMVAQDELILRVPVDPRAFGSAINWVEHKGPKCIRAETIRSAVLSGPDQVDFLMAGHQRLRAELDEDCPALDFYAGFYLQPQDEQVCRGRDAIHSRMGGSCMIKKFKRLEPKLAH